MHHPIKFINLALHRGMFLPMPTTTMGLAAAISRCPIPQCSVRPSPHPQDQIPPCRKDRWQIGNSWTMWPQCQHWPIECIWLLKCEEMSKFEGFGGKLGINLVCPQFANKLLKSLLKLLGKFLYSCCIKLAKI